MSNANSHAVARKRVRRRDINEGVACRIGPDGRSGERSYTISLRAPMTSPFMLIAQARRASDAIAETIAVRRGSAYLVCVVVAQHNMLGTQP